MKKMYIQESSKIIVLKVMEFSLGEMVENMKVIGKIIICQGWESMFGQMDEFILVIGKTVDKMEMVFFNFQIKRRSMVFGNKVNDLKSTQQKN